MQLLLPELGSLGLVTRPVDIGAEACVQLQPVDVPLIVVVVRMGVDPVLVGIDRRDPAERIHHALQMLTSSAVGLLLGVELVEERMCQKLHAHRCHFGEFDWRMTIGQKRLIFTEHGMEGMSGLVDHRLDITLETGCIHEYERDTSPVAVVLIATAAPCPCDFPDQDNHLHEACRTSRPDRNPFDGRDRRSL